MGSGHGIPRAADARSLVVDSAISHCEKLRRVLELESWIREAHDCPLLARASERWQAGAGGADRRARALALTFSA